MKNLFIRLTLSALLLALIVTSCNREDTVLKELTPQQQLEEVQLLMKKENRTEAEQELLFEMVKALPSDLTTDAFEAPEGGITSGLSEADEVYCVYGVKLEAGFGLCRVNSSGIATFCVLCPGNVQKCPGAPGGTFRYYDSDGNLICIGEIQTSSIVCTTCEDGGIIGVPLD